MLFYTVLILKVKIKKHHCNKHGNILQLWRNVLNVTNVVCITIIICVIMIIL